MESRNLDRALDIVSKLINGENVGENGDNVAAPCSALSPDPACAG